MSLVVQSDVNESSNVQVESRIWSKWTQIIFGALGLSVTLELTFFILYRRVNLDEGWYLWASKLVYDGQILYRDFVYT